MKHINPTSKVKALPAQASLIETQAKVGIFSTFATSFGVFANSIGNWLGIIDEIRGEGEGE